MRLNGRIAANALLLNSSSQESEAVTGRLGLTSARDFRRGEGGQQSSKVTAVL